MVTIIVYLNLQSNDLYKYIPVFLQTENSMTSRAYIGEMPIQVWLKSIEK